MCKARPILARSYPLSNLTVIICTGHNVLIGQITLKFSYPLELFTFQKKVSLMCFRGFNGVAYFIAIDEQLQ